MNQNNIRNFCIISHIDHGKSTLADRFLELTQTVEKRKMKEQYLDHMELEREKGITIKLQPVRMAYELKNPKSEIRNSKQIQNPNDQNLDSRFRGNDKVGGNDSEQYILNLIDTPGHVDFTYEVSRSLQAVEGAILLVDATKGIQAQTLANLHLALDQNLTIIPAINKIDLEGARIEEVENEIKELFLGMGREDLLNQEIYKISGKEGIGVEDLLKAVVEKISPPKIEREKPLSALVFDSVYDSYKGVLAYVRIIDGEIKKGDQILMMASGAKSEAIEVGFFKPNLSAAEKL